MNNQTRKYFAFFKRLALAALLAHPFVLQAACDSTLPLTTPKEHFTNNRDGTVTDNTTGLMWTLCLYGQAGNDCTGTSAFINNGTVWLGDWDTAVAATAYIAIFGYSGWRIPNVKELASIMEAGCTAPALNPAVFPVASAGDAPVWTSSPQMSDVNQIWVVDFSGDGMAYPANRVNTGYLRLVRDINANGSGQIIGY